MNNDKTVHIKKKSVKNVYDLSNDLYEFQFQNNFNLIIKLITTV